MEGIGSTKTKLHTVQQKLADAHGSQCGFCTPGIVMSMYTLLRNNPAPKMEDIETYFQVRFMLLCTRMHIIKNDAFFRAIFVDVPDTDQSLKAIAYLPPTLNRHQDVVGKKIPILEPA